MKTDPPAFSCRTHMIYAKCLAERFDVLFLSRSRGCRAADALRTFTFLTRCGSLRSQKQIGYGIKIHNDVN